MKYTEDELRTWSAPLSQTEEARADNAIKMIKIAIAADDELKSMDVEVFTQGSYANNTNVRTESDVDVCVMLKDVFHSDYPAGKTREDYGFSAAELTFDDYRIMVKRALMNKFRSENIHDGNKSIKIDENTYHVKADVVPAFQYRNYSYTGGKSAEDYVEGTWFKSKSGQYVTNYPKIHIKNGNSKNVQTNHRYKKLVRIMKHIKNDMVDDKITNGEIISSFLVECLVWNVPNNIIIKNDTWTNTVRNAISWLYTEINEGRHKEWGEVSEVLYLFRGRKWTDEDAKQWLVDAWNYLEIE